MPQPITLQRIKSAFLGANYRLDHTSHDSAGRVASYYFEEPFMGVGERRRRIRVSNHELGMKHLEGDRQQTARCAVDFCLADYYDETKPADFVRAAEDFIRGDGDFYDEFYGNGGVVR